MKIYSSVTGIEREALEKSYRRYGVAVLAGFLLVPVGAAQSRNAIGGGILLLSSACLISSGWIVKFDRLVALEIRAVFAAAGRPGQSRGTGMLLIAVGVAVGLFGLATALRYLV